MTKEKPAGGTEKKEKEDAHASYLGKLTLLGVNFTEIEATN